MLQSNESGAQALNEQKITSLEIAEITGKNHKELLRSIRNQEVGWKKVTGRKFALIKYKDSRGRKKPMYALTQKESLYIASKFNDEVRAKLVLRWYDLEEKQSKPINGIYPIRQGDKVGYPRKEALESIGRSGTSGAAYYLKKLYPDHCLSIGRAACIDGDLFLLLKEKQEIKKRLQQLKSNQLNLAL